VAGIYPETELMKVKVWGVRGSIPTPGESTIKYGGNTPCLHIEVPTGAGAEPGATIVFDAGTGIRPLGDSLLKQYSNGQPMSIYLFLTHLHWDHIQGLPFFSPMYRAQTRLRLYGSDQKNIEEMLLHQLHPDHFPVSLEDDDIKAEFEFNPLKGPVKIGPITIRHHYVNHVPAGTVVGFRADSKEGSLVYIPDNEPYGFESKLGCAADPRRRDDERGLIEFVRNADVMFFDTMFTEDDYQQYKGWGHSPVEYALEVAVEAGVKSLGLFHYAPTRKDEEIDRFVEYYAPKARERGVEVFASREGMVLDIGRKDS